MVEVGFSGRCGVINVRLLLWNRWIKQWFQACCYTGHIYRYILGAVLPRWHVSAPLLRHVAWKWVFFFPAAARTKGHVAGLKARACLAAPCPGLTWMSGFGLYRGVVSGGFIACCSGRLLAVSGLQTTLSPAAGTTNVIYAKGHLF